MGWPQGIPGSEPQKQKCGNNYKFKLHVLQTSLVIAKLVNKLKSNCPALDSLVACLLVAQLDDLYYIYLDFCFDHLVGAPSELQKAI